MDLVNVSPGNGLLLDGTKSLPGSMLICHQMCTLTNTCTVIMNSIRNMCSEITLLKLLLHLPGAYELMLPVIGDNDPRSRTSVKMKYFHSLMHRLMYDRHMSDDLLLDILTNIRTLTNLTSISAILQQSKIVLSV